MKRKIVVEIDSDDRHCGRCRFAYDFDCTLYAVTQDLDEMKRVLRHGKCLAAEQAATRTQEPITTGPTPDPEWLRQRLEAHSTGVRPQTTCRACAWYYSRNRVCKRNQMQDFRVKPDDNACGSYEKKEAKR